MRVCSLLLSAAFLVGAPTPSTLPPGIERAYGAVSQRVDGEAAMDVVRYLDRYWRLAGNPGFNASIDYLRDHLSAAGLAPRVEEFANAGKGWDYTVGTVAFTDNGEVVLS